MIRLVAVCSVAVGLLLAVSGARAAPPPKAGHAPSGLESADPAVRRDAVAKLVTSRDPTAVAQLALALEGDDDEAVRQAAASGLGELADKRGISALRRCLKVEASQGVKRSCRVALARLDPDAATAEPEPAAAPAAAAPPVGLAPAPTAASPMAPAPAAGSQLDLRINLTPQEVAERPNHIYVELWAALDKNTLALGFERVLGPHWTIALEPQFSAESQNAGGLKASAVSVALAARPHYYFLQQAPSGPYIAPFGAVGYARVTFDFPPGSSEPSQKITGTVWAVGAGVGWSLAINARAVFKLSAVFAFSKAAASAGAMGVEQSSSSASFSPFASAGIMF